jgi:aryl-alcohol dehydrogenase-like predicted oxidoreductase
MTETPDTPSKKIPSVAHSYLLGRSGLRVSPLCLGTMTFGNDWGWGSEKDAARAIFLRYLEAGGNFIDTADLYTNGRSEELIGEFMKEAGNRERVVVATKYTFSARPDDPNAGGNGRKHLMEAVNGSLRRLQTDYIDLYWVHAWDGLTPVEEVMSSLNDLVRAGKIRHIGLSDVPGWYVGRAQTLAEWRGWERVCALQLEYSLIERNIEREFVAAAQELGLGICPWSPLGSGVLTGKYRRPSEGGLGEGRLKTVAESGNPVFDKLNETNFKILDAVLEVSKALGRSPAQVALNWIAKRPGVVSTIIGATKLSQLDDNLAALEFDIPADLSAKLEEASRPAPQFPYIFFGGFLRGMMGDAVSAEPRWYRG